MDVAATAADIASTKQHRADPAELDDWRRSNAKARAVASTVYFVLPPSGDAIVTLGATASQEEVQKIKAAIGSIVRRSIGLEPGQCREIVYAMGGADERRHLERGLMSVAGSRWK